MWIALVAVSIILVVVVVAWRLTKVGRRTPADNDPNRQHEVPGAHAPSPGTIEGGVKRAPGLREQERP